MSPDMQAAARESCQVAKSLIGFIAMALAVDFVAFAVLLVRAIAE